MQLSGRPVTGENPESFRIALKVFLKPGAPFKGGLECPVINSFHLSASSCFCCFPFKKQPAKTQAYFTQYNDAVKDMFLGLRGSSRGQVLTSDKG
jgi:hypothetical protein